MKVTFIINYFVSLFMLCSPVAAIPAFLTLMNGREESEQRRVAVWLGLAVAVILLVATWIGGPILKILGIRIDAFQLAGGVIVFLLSLSMLNAQMSPMRQPAPDHRPTRGEIPIVPLAIPVMTGPGALSGVIAMANTYHTFFEMLILSLCNIGVGVLVGATLYFSSELEKKLGPSGLNIITRIGGLILAALAAQIVTEGIQGIFLTK
jgi:multiple antibiotic resistance protein